MFGSVGVSIDDLGSLQDIYLTFSEAFGRAWVVLLVEGEKFERSPKLSTHSFRASVSVSIFLLSYGNNCSYGLHW